MLFDEEVKKHTSLSAISNLILVYYLNHFPCSKQNIYRLYGHIVASLKRLAVRVPKNPA